MTIEIHPQLELAIEQRMATGAFSSIDELLTQAVAAVPVPVATPEKTGGQALIDAFAPIRGLFTDEEIDTLFARDRSITGRATDPLL